MSASESRTFAFGLADQATRAADPTLPHQLSGDVCRTARFATSLTRFPAFQNDGILRISTRVARLIHELSERDAPSTLAFSIAEADISDQDDSDVYEFLVGKYSKSLQVWLFDPEFGGSAGLVPERRRLLSREEDGTD